MDKLTEAIRAAMLATDRIGPKWRIKIVGKETVGKSDWARVEVNLYKPRHRKPHAYWILVINMVREEIHWDKSNYARLRED